MQKTIAIVEDEPDIAELIGIHLDKAGYKTKIFLDGASFCDYIEKSLPDLIILDLMLPDMDGYDICKKIKNSEASSMVSIIILSAKSEEVDKILGLELGADDYVVKPFSPRELVARIKAVLRRRVKDNQTRKVEIGELVLDNDRFSVTVSDRTIDLTPSEFRVLELLVSKAGWVFTRSKILDHLWGEDKAVTERTIDVHIRHLREKLGDYAKLIKNIRGVGYKFEGETEI